MAPADAPPPPPPSSGPWPPPGQPQGQWPPPGPPATPWPPPAPSAGQAARRPASHSAPGPGGPQTPWGGWGNEEGRRPATAPRTSPLAVAALLSAALGWWLFGLGALAGIALGLVSLQQIQQSNGSLKGRGLAIAGIALGAAFCVAYLLAIILAYL